MIGVVCHDAGGAEVLSSYVRRNGVPAVFALGGPARSVFTRKLGSVDSVDVEAAVAAASWVLCGTSWQSDIELQAIDLARASGKRVVAFIDHWVNYRERFQREGRERLPDEVWVGDAYALEAANRAFPDLPIAQVDNPYFLDLERELAEAQSRQPVRPPRPGARVLFVCEPTSEHAALSYGNARHWGYTEHDALRFFLEHVETVIGAIDHILVRPHPAERAGKYDWLLSDRRVEISVPADRLLVDDIADADVVGGCNSMALVVGLLGRRRVLSCIPPGGARCALPHQGIESLQELVRIATGSGAIMEPRQ